MKFCHLLIGAACLFLVHSAMAAPEIKWPDDLEPHVKMMLEHGLRSFDQHPAVPYKTGSSSLKDGMDCSGAIVFLLQTMKVTPPRSSAAMFAWMKDAKTFTKVPETAREMTDPIYQKLRPGDLIFWATDDATAAGHPKVTHVHMYLGEEKSDGRKVMIGSSNGRSYRSVKREGYGIVDFRVPARGGKTRIVGFGPVPMSAAK